MTARGLLVLRSLRDGGAKTAAEIASLAGVCERKTRAALVGAFAGGLVVEQVSDARRWAITEAGLEVLSDLESP